MTSQLETEIGQVRSVGNDPSSICQDDEFEAIEGQTELYRHFDGKGKLLYVGISIDAIARLRRHRKGSDWFDDIRSISIETFDTRAEALEAERIAIQCEKPKWNVIHRDPGNLRRIPKPSPHETTAEALAARLIVRPLYTIKEVHDVLGISAPRVKELMDENKLGYVSYGSRRYITGWQLIDFIEWWQSVGSI